MASEEANAATRREWRELGFWYDLDEEAREWRLAGDREGLLRFADLLRRFALDPRNAVIGEHEHHGPYMYLELMTSGTPGMDGGSIHGRPGDLLLLAGLIEERLASTRPGDRVRIEWECAAAGSFALVLDRREEGVDPASLDPLLPPAG